MVLLKKIALALLGILSGALAIVTAPNLLYNLGGLSELQDFAEGPKWANALIMLVCAAIAGAGFFLSYRSFKLCARVATGSK